MTITALTFEEVTFKRQKDTLYSIISVSYETNEPSHEFYIKTFYFLKACQCIWDSGSLEHTYFYDLAFLFHEQNVSNPPLPISNFMEILLKEAKK